MTRKVSDPEKRKYQFIEDIIEHKGLNTNQKQRVIRLISKELQEKFNDIESIKKRIQQVEYSEKNKLPPTDSLPSYYIDSSTVSRFLIAYNQDPILRTTCHLIDSDELENIKDKCKTDKYEFEKHHELIIENFKVLTRRFKSNNLTVPQYLYALIMRYLTGNNDKGWSSDEVTMNWGHNDLKSWSSLNEGIPPNMDRGLSERLEKKVFEFKPFKSNITQNTIRTFSELTIHFKHLFHIRYDNSLKSIIENKNKSTWDGNVDFKISEDFIERIELFTDVDKLVQAYKEVIDLIIEESKKPKNPEKPIVVLSFKEDEERKKKIFVTHHTNTIYNKRISDIITRIGSSYCKIINKINGMCDFYLEAEFENNKCARINLWDGQERSYSEIGKMEGVKHIFEFRSR